MDARRGTPRHDAPQSRGQWRGGLIALGIVAVLAVASSSLARCSGEPVADAGREVPLVVEATSEEALAREEFVNTWAERIDTYNAGYPLEGYGATFAAAAYDYGIDPRIAPAIARVESGSGSNCFRSHNAWGWGRVSWADWETAIWAFEQGFSEKYGAEMTYEVAQVYNQANVDEWYARVTSCMDEIWPENSL